MGKLAKSKERRSSKRKLMMASENGVHNTQLYVDVAETKWPVIYSPEYNIGFLGLEKLHPFDAGKWGRVYQFLKDADMLRDDTSVRSLEASGDDLMVVHSKSYLNSLKWSITVAGITEIPPVALLPNPIVQRKVLKPFRYQTGGTILAGKLALERGWAINIGGGFHHCSAERGGGFCAYADITLTIKFLLTRKPEQVKRAMIIDLDAHQGNGHERDFMNNEQVYIMDVYNRGIYPHDAYAKRGIKRRVELSHFTEDEEYLQLVERHVEGALNEFSPDVIVYNAGTDILDGDPLGCLSISAEGIIKRDYIVFKKARDKNIPIIMVTSGGYQRSTARIIADSILNLRKKNLIACEAAENCSPPSDNTTTEQTDLPSPTGIPRSTSESGIFSKFRRWFSSSNTGNEPSNNVEPALSSTGATGQPSPDISPTSPLPESQGVASSRSAGAITPDGATHQTMEVFPGSSIDSSKAQIPGTYL